MDIDPIIYPLYYGNKSWIPAGLGSKRNSQVARVAIVSW